MPLPVVPASTANLLGVVLPSGNIVATTQQTTGSSGGAIENGLGLYAVTNAGTITIGNTGTIQQPSATVTNDGLGILFSAGDANDGGTIGTGGNFKLESGGGPQAGGGPAFFALYGGTAPISGTIGGTGGGVVFYAGSGSGAGGRHGAGGQFLIHAGAGYPGGNLTLAGGPGGISGDGTGGNLILTAGTGAASGNVQLLPAFSGLVSSNGGTLGNTTLSGASWANDTLTISPGATVPTAGLVSSDGLSLEATTLVGATWSTGTLTIAAVPPTAGLVSSNGVNLFDTTFSGATWVGGLLTIAAQPPAAGLVSSTGTSLEDTTLVGATWSAGTLTIAGSGIQQIGTSTGPTIALSGGLAITSGTLAPVLASGATVGGVSVAASGLMYSSTGNGALTAAIAGQGIQFSTASIDNIGIIKFGGFGAALGSNTITLCSSLVMNSAVLSEKQALNYMFPGLLTGGEIDSIVMMTAGTLLANGGAHQAYIPTNPTATNTLLVNTVHSGTITTQGTITIATSGAVTFPTFSAVTMVAGDVVQLQNQATADVSLANPCFALQYQVT